MDYFNYGCFEMAFSDVKDAEICDTICVILFGEALIWLIWK